MLQQNSHQNFDLIELQALRSEVGIRIVIQNGCVLLSALLLCAASAAMTAWPDRAMVSAIALGLSIGVCALVWCHNGVRQCQIKAYLLVLAARHSRDGGWERWLPNDRMPGVLGNRWFIATKGAMLGAQGAGFLLALVLGGMPQLLPLLSAVLILIGTATLLLTNPKEAIRSQVPHLLRQDPI